MPLIFDDSTHQMEIPNQIFQQMGVALVEVGHDLYKPSVDSVVKVIVGDIGIVKCRQAEVGGLLAVGVVEPVFRIGISFTQG